MDSTSDVADEQRGTEISGVEIVTSSTDVAKEDHKRSGSKSWDWFVKFFSYGGVILIIALVSAVAIAVLQWLEK